MPVKDQAESLEINEAKANPRPSNQSDTIAAIATPTGSGGIGVVRISGKQCQIIAQDILGQFPKPRYATYLDFRLAQGHLLDRGIAIYFKAPHSYTGEDVLELQAHGGMVLLQLLLERCLELGARQAEPGEFTLRAYLNGKIDLTQAEAVADIINASTEEAAKSAMRSLSGEFSSQIKDFLKKLTDLRMYVEACLDFPEEEIDFITQGAVSEKLEVIIQALKQVLRQSCQGHLLREGMQVVLVGQPNAGKSTLINRLAGESLAIVTAQPGTTRDTIKAPIQIQGVPFHIIDTAGLHETEDEIEKLGIAKTWQAIRNADLVLIILDAKQGIGFAEQEILQDLPSGLPRIWVHNKIDLLGEDQHAFQPWTRDHSAQSLSTQASITDANEHHVFISAKNGWGIETLQKQLLDISGWQNQPEGVFMARTRHLEALKQVSQHLTMAASLMAQGELLAEELRQAQEILSTITGDFTPDDLLGEIFSRFCIGK